MERGPKPVDEERGFGEKRLGVIGGKAVRGVALDWEALRRRLVGERHQGIDGGPVQLGQRTPFGHLAPEHPVAEVLEHEEALVEVESIDGGRR